MMPLRKYVRPADEVAPSWSGPLLALSILNFFVFALVSGYLGGDALGTTPDRGGFFLEAHGKQTIVSEATWAFSLFYSWISLLLPFIGIWARVAVLGRKAGERRVAEEGGRPHKPPVPLGLMLLSLFGIVWAFLVTVGAARSLLAWVQSTG
jgi:hypothetical protein